MKPIYKIGKVGDIRHSILNNSRAMNDLNWYPKYSIESGLNEMINDYLNIKTRSS
ncbi:hypothetical protein D3C77_717280 [compost metagenome]